MIEASLASQPGSQTYCVLYSSLSLMSVQMVYNGVQRTDRAAALTAVL